MTNHTAEAHEAPNLSAALEYATRYQWRVFPAWWPHDGRCACGTGCGKSAAKHPLTRSGVHDASTDPDVIRTWWARWPLANVAIATGRASGLVVIDLDVRPGKDGRASLRSIGPMPLTATARTGSGGLHLYYAHPGVDVPNSAGRVGPGIDVRGEGGYVLAPPSRHASGGTYSWEVAP